MAEWLKARLAARLVGERAVIPTSDFYVLGALGGTGICRLGPFSYATPDGAVIVVRHLTRADRAALERAPPGQLFYVIDDLVDAAALRGSGLPADYRARLEAGRRTRDLVLARRPVVVAPNAAVAAQFPDTATRLVPPSLVAACADFGHFDAMGLRPRIACLGTRSHRADLEAIAPALEEVSRRRPELEIVTFLGRHLPDRLRRLATVRNRRPLPWPLFKRVLRRERFHLALAPLRDTPFNRARAPTKLLDHAAVGAAGLYSARAPYRDVVTSGRDGVLVGDPPEEWAAAIARLLDDPAGARRIAENGVALARRVGDPALARAAWSGMLADDRDDE